MDIYIGEAISNIVILHFFRSSYDFIHPTNKRYSAIIRPGQIYTLGPQSFLAQFFDYIGATQPDSTKNEYFIQRKDGPPLPELQFETGSTRLTLRPQDYLSEVC